jgi:putative flippase GtrA/2-polyprenyl-3-methyl-5-hydroxy-6-metoxy-1,4-benzoquinol methylase
MYLFHQRAQGNVVIGRSLLGYAAVSVLCWLLSNAILIAGDRANFPLSLSLGLSYVLVVAIGYFLHSLVSFGQPLSAPAFSRYALAMSLNIPLAFAAIWLLRDEAGLPMLWAAPLATGGTTAINFLLSRWAVSMREPLNRIDPQDLQPVLAEYLAVYRAKVPRYQATMLSCLLDLWPARHYRLLDVGGGTGVIAQAVSEFFPVDGVETVDRVDRFCAGLSVSVKTYDGHTLPYSDGSFDAAMMNNVMHHVPVEARIGLLREIRRVVAGPLYIKDHEHRGWLDRLRLMALDILGNIPFGGVLWASYLNRADWDELAAASSYRITARTSGSYRTGSFAFLFPNRLEITMRFEP